MVYTYISSFGLALPFHLLYRAIAAISKGRKQPTFRDATYDSTVVSSAIYEAGSVRKLLKKKTKTRGAKTKLVSES